MSISRHVDEFIALVGIHFPPPARDEKAALWELSMDKTLRHMPQDVLSKAAEIIIETRKPQKDGKWFPTPSECIEACSKARRALETESPSAPLLSQGDRDKSPWASWRIDRADELLRTTSMGRQAASEGWALALHDYIRANQRLPSERDVVTLKAQSAEHRDLVEMCERREAGTLSGPLARLGRSILERGKDMAEFVAGKGDATWRR